MKHLLTLSLSAALLLAIFNVHAQPVAKAKTKGKAAGNAAQPGGLTVQGAYTMLRQVANDGTKDSLLGTEQLKIYTDRYMMYARPHPTDSLGDYGIGTYEIKNGKVVEHVFYTAADGAQNNTFELDIKKTGDGYSQVFVVPEYQGKRWTVTEDYKSVGKNVSTPLDGAWKQTRRTAVLPDGRTVVDDNPTQYKVYQSGYVMWAN
ncbi:MAG: hypothetical protein M3342_08880, partial [Bacteroidota bacterium]|nr:hypothetical protein [Bacteroidota bacterium]